MVQPDVGSTLFMGSLFHMVVSGGPPSSVNPCTLMVMNSEAGTVPSSQRPPGHPLVQAEPTLRSGTVDLTLKREEMMPGNLRLRR